jgi:chromosome partitioning protein
LTAVDDLDEATLNARPTMSHVTARLEMLKLLAAMGLDRAMTSQSVDQGRDAA